MNETETAVRRHVARLARGAAVSDDQLDLDCPLRQEYAISSMKMVMLMTALCNELGVSLSSFDERHLAGVRSGRDLVRLFDQARQAPAAPCV